MDPQGTKRPRVLIVDDQDTARGLVRLCLWDQSDLVIEEADSGGKAIQQAIANPPSVVLMDIGMPGMNGIEATIEIRRFLPSVKVIAVTRHDSPEYRRAMQVAGAQEYILKSHLPGELVQMIRQALETSIAGPPVETGETSLAPSSPVLDRPRGPG